ncbi:hypothetical protein Salat_0201300 [Sesamum alatum]|uniref:Myb/SANT-like domain-containing protein n=1 Tax=Sesamum alatum TaxID=300844 RepID=A0AAE1YZ82_9LAMI|nr:hypothetical protein Salat_0201300 [Sesamum alatum]
MTRFNPSIAFSAANGNGNYVPKPAPSTPCQQRFLYTSVWTAAHDQVFLDCLWDLAMAGKLEEGGVIPPEALKRATEQTNLIMKESFTCSQNRHRVEKLRDRYEIFRYLLSCPEVISDRWDNTIIAPSDFWERVTKTYPLAAYEHYGDPNWSALLAIFGPSNPSVHASSSSSYEGNDNEVEKIERPDRIVEIDGVLQIPSDSA